ncbi:phage portal protein [Paenibacillus lupini]|uniref:phage portal protein n=1 Tax=Paenibacillus lupini TaxID=1450204 RepID=UPI0014224D6A|nr:phage portal protein [Paenibacillus lupini]NIK24197.1 HK97 family phage portal protein [Paenibacillus lupini]
MGFWNKIFRSAADDGPLRVKLVSDRGDWYTSWNGSLYKSDVVRSAIRPKVKAAGKLVPLHIRESPDGSIKVNPDAYLRFLLEEPNPYSTGQMMLEKMATQVQLNNNAFALIYRDDNGYPMQLYPITMATRVEAIRNDNNELSLKFWLPRGSTMTVPYSDVIHLRDDYSDNDVFGSPKADALESLLETLNASDQSIVNAVKTSATIRWIMKFKQVLKKTDRELQVSEFVNSYLTLDNDDGVAYADPRYDLEQVKPNAYVPPTSLQKEAVNRVHSFFGVNENIVQAKYDEDEWTAWYEAEVEPLAMQIAGEMTRKFFSRRERGFGNRITLDSGDLSFASMNTKLQLMQMVDRGAMTPNEWRRVMNLPPIEGGDKAIRRLDTAVVDDGKATSTKGGGKGA